MPSKEAHSELATTNCKETPATFETLRVEAGERGFDHLAEIHAAMKKEAPDFRIGETAMYIWASDLKDDGHLPAEIDVLKLELQIYPGSKRCVRELGRGVSEFWGKTTRSREL
jgi:hypothetical protein